VRSTSGNAKTASYFNAAGSALNGAVQIGKGWKSSAQGAKK